jgi:cell division protein FtsB
MTNEKKTAAKAALVKVGKAVWSALPWVGLVIWIACLIISPVLQSEQRGELEAQISALEAENAMYEAEQAHLEGEIDWLRSLITEDGDGQTK